MGQDPRQPYPDQYGQDPQQPYPGQYGQDPQQPYPGQYGQPPQQPPYQGGYQQQGAYPPPNTGYQQPNSGYQQQQSYQHQQPYGQAGPLYYPNHPNGATSLNMDPNTAAGLSYFTWIAGLIFFLAEKQNRFVRFNAMQELLLTATVVVAYAIFAYIPFIGLILTPFIGIVGFVIWLICVINAFQGKSFKLPVIGDYAERFANSGTPNRM